MADIIYRDYESSRETVFRDKILRMILQHWYDLEGNATCLKGLYSCRVQYRVLLHIKCKIPKHRSWVDLHLNLIDNVFFSRLQTSILRLACGLREISLSRSYSQEIGKRRYFLLIWYDHLMGMCEIIWDRKHLLWRCGERLIKSLSLGFRSLSSLGPDCPHKSQFSKSQNYCTFLILLYPTKLKMQFEVVAKCHTTKARVCKMTLPRTSYTWSDERD